MMLHRNRFHAQIMEIINNGRTDAERSNAVLLHDSWQSNRHYASGDVVRRGEALYRCLIEHDAQPSWTPEDASSLWAKIMYRDGIRIIPDVIEATQAFALDERGWWGDVLYKSLIAANVYTPEQYPAGWEAVE